jgi:hypothetical protein
MHGQTAVKTEGIEALLRQHPTVTATVDDGYRGLVTAFGDQVHAPPRKPNKHAPAEASAADKTAHQAVLPADLRRARDRRAQAVAVPAALPRPP